MKEINPTLTKKENLLTQQKQSVTYNPEMVTLFVVLSLNVLKG